MRARIVLLGVEKQNLIGLARSALEPVNVTVDFVAAQRVIDGVQQRRFAATILAREHDERVRKVHDHRHVEIEVGENGMSQNLEKHKGRHLRIA